MDDGGEGLAEPELAEDQFGIGARRVRHGRELDAGVARAIEQGAEPRRGHDSVEQRAEQRFLAVGQFTRDRLIDAAEVAPDDGVARQADEVRHVEIGDDRYAEWLQDSGPGFEMDGLGIGQRSVDIEEKGAQAGAGYGHDT